MSVFLGFVHRHVFIWNTQLFGDGFCLRLQVEPIQLGPIGRAVAEIGTRSLDWAQLSRFHLKTEAESSLRNAMCFK
jgi:hypothetical protein